MSGHKVLHVQIFDSLKLLCRWKNYQFLEGKFTADQAE
jgi:hypothetical protein